MSEAGPKRLYGCGAHGTFTEVVRGGRKVTKNTYSGICPDCNPIPTPGVRRSAAQMEAVRLQKEAERNKKRAEKDARRKGLKMKHDTKL